MRRPLRGLLRSGAMRYPLLALLCGLMLLGGLLGGLLHDDGRIAEGVLIQGVPVGGLTPEAARAKLVEALRPWLPSQVTLRQGTGSSAREWVLSAAKFSWRADLRGAVRDAYRLTREGTLLEQAWRRWTLVHQPVDLPVEVIGDAAALRNRLLAMAPLVNRAPRNARVVDVVGHTISLGRERDGWRLDAESTVAEVFGDGQFPAPAEVALVLRRDPAEVTREDLEQHLKLPLATYTTSMSHGYHGVMRANRAHNVRLCLARMNGTVLAPGEEFSFNQVIGERLSRDGFRDSIIFVRKPDGTIDEQWDTGGGICQLSSTLFNAALYANLKITQRSNHSKPVHYTPLARDAAVHYDAGVDLRFVNTGQYPIMLWGTLSDNLDLTLQVWGDPADDRDVDLYASSWGTASGTGGELRRTVRSLDGKDIEADREFICASSYR